AWKFAPSTLTIMRSCSSSIRECNSTSKAVMLVDRISLAWREGAAAQRLPFRVNDWRQEMVRSRARVRLPCLLGCCLLAALGCYRKPSPQEFEKWMNETQRRIEESRNMRGHTTYI